MILTIHTLFSILALLTGIIFLMPKGTKLHKKLGYGYSCSMIICVTTSFGLFKIWGHFGVYHVLSIVSFVTLMFALFFPLFGRHRKGWVQSHLIWMGYSYVGLLMAGGSHLFGLTPDWPTWLQITLFWALPYVVGSVLIFSNRKKAAEAAKRNLYGRS
jgi:uncharacterized membrane protein